MHSQLPSSFGVETQRQCLELHWDRWGDTRTFPLAVWPAYRRCTGLHSLQKAESKSAPLIAKCRYKDLSPKKGMVWDGYVNPITGEIW